MSQQKIDKREGAETKCTTCGLDLICLPFEFHGNKQLSWCDKETGQKHYTFDSESKESSCKYTPIVTYFQLLDRIERLVKKKMAGQDEKRVNTYIDLIFKKLVGV